MYIVYLFQRVNAVLQVAFDIPVIITYIIVVASYAYDLYLNIYTIYIKRKKVQHFFLKYN